MCYLSTMNCRFMIANIHLIIFNIGSFVHWLNYSIKVSVTYNIVLLIVHQLLGIILQTAFFI